MVPAAKRARSGELALGDLAQQEVAEDLDALRGPEFFGIDEIAVDPRTLELGQDAHQAGRFLRHVFRQRGEAEAALHRAEDRIDTVDFEDRPTLIGVALATGPQQPVDILDRRFRRVIALDHDGKAVPFLGALWKFMPLYVGGAGLEL